MHQCDHNFAHKYDFELLRTGVLAESGASGLGLQVVHVPAAQDSGAFQLAVRVEPVGRDPWIGIFEGGSFAFSSVSTMPDATQLCIVSHGAAYVVSVEFPECARRLDFGPVTDVRASLEHQLLILASHAELLAIGTDLTWEAEPVAECIEIERIDHDLIWVRGFDRCEVRMGIDPVNGQVVPRSRG